VSAVSTGRLPEGLGSSKLEIILMKIAVLAVCILGSSAAFAQAVASGSVNAQPQVYAFESHPEHASRKALRSAEDLNGNEIVVYAQGERPLWEVATPVQEVALGDSARALRQEHATMKKAARCWQNQ
jgi:protein-disulfide isomerase